MNSGGLSAPMPGKLTKLFARIGETVEEGETLLVIEAMKMQNEIKVPSAGKITVIHVEAGGRAEKSDLIVEYEVSD